MVLAFASCSRKTPWSDSSGALHLVLPAGWKPYEDATTSIREHPRHGKLTLLGAKFHRGGDLMAGFVVLSIMKDGVLRNDSAAESRDPIRLAELGGRFVFGLGVARGSCELVEVPTRTLARCREDSARSPGFVYGFMVGDKAGFAALGSIGNPAELRADVEQLLGSIQDL